MMEIYQNCNVFNDGAFFIYTDKETRALETLYVEQDKPLVFGENNSKGIRFSGGRPEIVSLESGEFSPDDLWVHNEKDIYKAHILCRFFDNPDMEGHFPRPFGVIYAAERPTYEDAAQEQLRIAKTNLGPGDLDKLLRGKETWQVDDMV
jgi:2-oxoglutarate ferredoxin oxidoreductase subunit beta